MKEILSWIWQTGTCIQDRIIYKGADFGSFVRWKDLNWDKTHGNEYKPSTIGNLEKVLNQLDITENDSVLDIGCGKGKVMYILSGYPFYKVRGYDLSAELVEVANGNFKLLGCSDRCEAFFGDAERFDEYDNYNYFYFFNSVPYEVFTVLMSNIVCSLERKPRKIFFIYMHAEQEDYILERTSLKRVMKKKAWISFLVDWFDISVYSNT